MYDCYGDVVFIKWVYDLVILFFWHSFFSIGRVIVMMTGNYQPGTCNIDAHEQQQRKRIGILGLTAALLLTGLAYWTGSVSSLHQGAIVGACIIGWTGIVQWKMQFCVGFAVLGKHSLSNGITTITDNTAHRADLIKAAKIQGLSVILGLISATLATAPLTGLL